MSNKWAERQANINRNEHNAACPMGQQKNDPPAGPSREDSDLLRSMTETLWNLQLIKARVRNTTVNEITQNRPGIKKIFNGTVIQVPGVYSSIKLEDIKIK